MIKTVLKLGERKFQSGRYTEEEVLKGLALASPEHLALGQIHSLYIPLDRIAGVINLAFLDGDELKIDFNTLPTPCGHILESLIRGKTDLKYGLLTTGVIGPDDIITGINFLGGWVDVVSTAFPMN